MLATARSGGLECLDEVIGLVLTLGPEEEGRSEVALDGGHAGRADLLEFRNGPVERTVAALPQEGENGLGMKSPWRGMSLGGQSTAAAARFKARSAGVPEVGSGEQRGSATGRSGAGISSQEPYAKPPVKRGSRSRWWPPSFQRGRRDRSLLAAVQLCDLQLHVAKTRLARDSRESANDRCTVESISPPFPSTSSDESSRHTEMTRTW